MKIKVGATYRNRGGGRTSRKVLAIGDDHRPEKFLSTNPPPDEPGVLFEQDGVQRKLYLSSFIVWAGNEVK